MRQKVFFGEDCLTGLRDLFHANKWKRILLVTGKHSYVSSGAESFVNDCISGLDEETVRYCEFSNNPNIFDLKKGLALTRNFKPTVIIAIGGGSVLDMAKLIRFFLTHDGEVLSGQYKENHKEIPLIAIPTTAGTGAEATHFAVLYDESGKKHSIANPTILPDYAVVYPPLTFGQSPYVTACTGFDALAQAIEAYWNKNATEESDRYAEKAMNLIATSLRDAVNNPTNEVRDRMAEGAYWAGRAINITKTTAAHAFSYPFTSHYGVPHGHAVAIVFPTIAEFNLSQGIIPEYKKDRIYNLFGGKESLTNNLTKFLSSVGLSIPEDRDYNIHLLLKGINLERLANNPIKLSTKVSFQLLNNIITKSTIEKTTVNPYHYDRT